MICIRNVQIWRNDRVTQGQGSSPPWLPVLGSFSCGWSDSLLSYIPYVAERSPKRCVDIVVAEGHLVRNHIFLA